MARAWQTWVGALLLFGAQGLASAATAQEAQDVVSAPDFSEVTSKTAANKRVRQGQLVKIRAFPAELGGPDDPRNILYIPPRAEEDRQRLIARLRRLLEQDLIDQLDVQADYKGKSIIPSRLRYTATHSRGGEPIEGVVEVW